MMHLDQARQEYKAYSNQLVALVLIMLILSQLKIGSLLQQIIIVKVMDLEKLH